MNMNSTDTSKEPRGPLTEREIYIVRANLGLDIMDAMRYAIHVNKAFPEGGFIPKSDGGEFKFSWIKKPSPDTRWDSFFKEQKYRVKDHRNGGHYNNYPFNFIF